MMLIQMDTEELYDSLEDDFSSASSTSMSIEQSNCQEKLKLNLSVIQNTSARYEGDNKIMDCTFTPLSQWETNSNEITPSSKRLLKTRIPCYKPIKSPRTCKNVGGDISSFIPLYKGDVKKSEIQPSPNQVHAKNLKSKLKSKFTKPNATSGSCISIESLPKTGVSKSYLALFHNRIGYPNPEKKELNDTMRSIFGGSERSLFSDTSVEKEDFQDAEGYESDTASYYFKQIEEEEYKKSITNPNSLVSSIPPSNYESMSHLFVNQNNEEVDKKKLKAKNFKLLPIPILGSLGPDIGLSTQQKLERRKKQLSYGQKASNRNRIKMVEINVLKNLKKEIQESHSLDQKSIREETLESTSSIR